MNRRQFLSLSAASVAYASMRSLPTFAADFADMKKRVGLMGYGLEIVENVPIEIVPNVHNEKYLMTKRDKLGHNILKNK